LPLTVKRRVVESLYCQKVISLKAGFNMKLKSLSVALVMATIPLALFLGCNKGGQPTAPSNSSSLTINLASNPRAQFVGAAQNLILYNISGSSASITGSYGPLSASAITGPISISVNVPNVSNYNLISVEITNFATQQALAVGASALAGTNGSVTLGPLNKSFYQVSSLAAGNGFGFENDMTTFVGVNTATTIPGLDVVCNAVGILGYQLENPALTNNTVAYMGSGNFVNYLTVPANSRFSGSSSTSKAAVLGGNAQVLAIGDVYCVKILTGGYAWLQITSPGVVGVSGPGFVFRLNTTQNYCGYEQSKVDGAGPTPTPYAPVTVSASGVISGNDYGIAVFPANSAAGSIFVSDAVSGTNTSFVRILNPTVLTTIASIPALPWAQGVAVNSAGSTLYIASSYSQSAPSVLMYSVPGLTSLGAVGAGSISVSLPDTSVQALAGQMGVPEFVAVSPTSGNLFVTDSGTNGFADVLVMQAPTSVAGRAVTYWSGQIGTSTSPAGIATDGTTVYVADAGHNQIETYTVNGVIGNTWTTDNNPGGAVGFSSPYGIALDSALGEVFIADTGNNRVVEMTTSGVFKATWGTWGLGASTAPATLFSSPAAIAVDGANPPNVYVADSGNKRVLKFLGL
jgi:DNA-binding beta-propeller fold protein YncE